MSSRVTITEATEDDIPTLVELMFHLDAHVSGAPRAELKMTPQGMAELEARLRSFLHNSYKRLLVARHPRAGVIGMGNIALWLEAEVWETPERKGQWYAVIDDVWVEPKFRRQGVNRRMIAELVAFARNHGVEALQLEYAASNTEAARAWAKLGFSPIGIRAAATASEVMSRLGDDGQEH